MSTNNRSKNILNGVLETIQHLKKEKQSQRKHLKIITDSGIQIAEMIESSLDMFKMEENTYALEPKPCNLITIFQKLAVDLHMLAKQKGIHIHFYIDDNPMSDNQKFWVSGEYRLLQNLFANLVKNAMEASPHNENVRVDMDYQNSEMAMIQIHNMGVVPENLRDQFFDRYTTAGKKGGTGLGTYSAKLITKTHGGRIEFETDETMGTILFVTLPRATEPEENDQEDAEKQSMAFTLQGSVLIADDNLINQQVLKGLLEDHDIALDMVENGLEAVQKVESNKYDLILMDMEMPVMDGREAIQHIRKKYPDTILPIIALTAHNLAIEDINQNDNLINDIITKPIQPERMFNMLRSYLQVLPVTQVLETQDTKESFNKKDTTSQILNLDKALRQLMGKRYLLENVMQSFKKDHFNAPDIVKQLIESNQLSTAQRKVHSIKGLAGTIGAQMLQTVSQELETAIKHQMFPKIDNLLHSFRKSLDPVLEKIDQVLVNKESTDTEDPSLSNELSDQLNALEKNMNHLYTLLVDCDSEANDACNECLPALDFLTQNTEDQLMLDQLRQCLKNYLFDDAASIIEKLSDKLGLGLRKG